MSKKIILLALAAISAAMFALPAVASAGEWSLDSASGKYPVNFKLSSTGSTILTTDDGTGLKVTCKSAGGSGIQESATTSKEVTLTFSECTENLFSSKCTTSGQTAGTIKTTDLTGHNVKLEPSPSTLRGVLLTPKEGHFATFTCAGGLFSLKVGGTGIIGELISPTACNAVSNVATVTFQTVGEGTQKWTQVTTTGSKFDLTASKNGGTPVTAGQDGLGHITFDENMTFTC
jgi:hypothetical protein